METRTKLGITPILELHEGSLRLANGEYHHVFFLFDATDKTVVNLRVGKNKPSKTDKIRTINSAVNKKFALTKLKFNVFEQYEPFLVNNFSLTLASLSKSSLDSIPPPMLTWVGDRFILFLSGMTENKPEKINGIRELFNEYLVAVSKRKRFDRGFLNRYIEEFKEKGEEKKEDLNLDKERKEFSPVFETVLYQRKKRAYDKYLDCLKSVNFEEMSVDQYEDFISAKNLKRDEFKMVEESCSFSRKSPSFFVPNQYEIQIILAHTGMSVKRKRDYFSSLFKFSFFCLYYLGLDIDNIFVVKRSELFKMRTEKSIILHLNENKTVTRTIFEDTRRAFDSTRYYFDIVFEDSDQISRKNCGFSTKNLSFILNKDLKAISKAFFKNDYTVRCLQKAAPLRLLTTRSNYSVSKEFEITESFTKRLEKFYQVKYV